MSWFTDILLCFLLQTQHTTLRSYMLYRMKQHRHKYGVKMHFLIHLYHVELHTDNAISSDVWQSYIDTMLQCILCVLLRGMLSLSVPYSYPTTPVSSYSLLYCEYLFVSEPGFVVGVLPFGSWLLCLGSYLQRDQRLQNTNYSHFCLN